MNILIINFEYPPLGGGGGVATKQIAEELVKRHSVHVITTGYRGLPRAEKKNGVWLQRVPVIGRTSLPTASLLSMISFVPAAVVMGWRLCRREKFDVINAQFVLPSGVVGAVLARFYKIPFVVSFIGGDLFDPSKGISPHRHGVLRWLIRWIAAQADARTAISEDTKRRARELHGVRQSITVTHLGLVASTQAVLSRSEINVPIGVHLFVSIGRLIPRKRYDVLLRAWHDIPEAHLLIVGSGPLQARLQDLLVKYKLEGRVQLLGFVAEERKRQILRSADGYVSATLHEGFGIVFLEAMDAGLPIVASNEGGQTDFLIDGENALLVEPDDGSRLAAAVKQLVNDVSLRERMGAANRDKVKDFYLDKTVKRFETVLRKAAQK